MNNQDDQIGKPCGRSGVSAERRTLSARNRTRGTSLTAEQLLADCQARSGADHIFQQTYMCNPLPGAAGIVDWSAIERCRADYEIERVHLEARDVLQRFGQFSASNESERQHQIAQFLRKTFPTLFSSADSSIGNQKSKFKNSQFRLGFDVAASGEGDLAVFYIDEPRGSELWLRALLTVRTEDWNFLKTVLFYFLQHLPKIRAAGDESGLGRQICWEAAQKFSSRFLKVNFSAKKHDLGFTLMNQLSVAEKRFPRNQQDIASDYFALRKAHTGAKWVFSEGRNPENPVSHCDIAWAGALATFAHTERRCEVGAAVVSEYGNLIYEPGMSAEEANMRRMMLSNDPRIWKPL